MQSPPPNQQGFGYGNQYGTPLSTPMTGMQAAGAKEKSAIGLDGNIAAALSYLIGLLGLILFIMEKQNRFVRFHAIQAVLFHVAAVVVLIAGGIVFAIIQAILGMISTTLAILGTLLWLVLLLVVLAYVIGLFLFAYKSFQGQMFKAPLVGNMAEKFANK